VIAQIRASVHAAATRFLLEHAFQAILFCDQGEAILMMMMKIKVVIERSKIHQI
jgi:hypothetical protein